MKSAKAIGDLAAREVILVLSQGHFIWIIENQDYACRAEERCPFCGRKTVVRLPAPILAEQPDDTTHICHPTIGGCNQGFSVLETRPS